MNWEKSTFKSNIQKSQNLFVNWEESGSTAYDQHSKIPSLESMEELGKIMSLSNKFHR